MTFSPKRGWVTEYDCDNEGHHINCKCHGNQDRGGRHHFIILSPSDYNERSDYVLAIPLTSRNNKLTEYSGAGFQLTIAYCENSLKERLYYIKSQQQ